MLVAVEEVLNTGQAMSSAAREFANDPCSSVKRGNMVRLSFTNTAQKVLVKRYLDIRGFSFMLLQNCYQNLDIGHKN